MSNCDFKGQFAVKTALVDSWQSGFRFFSRIELPIIVPLPVGGCGRTPLGFVERVRALVLLSHSVHDEHHHQDGTQQPDYRAAYYS